MGLPDALKTTLGAPYVLEGELSGGGMSRVFVARDEGLGRRVVAKVLHPELAAGVNIERFRREIRIAAQLVHPHIVPLLSAGEVDGLPFYTMPLLEGESLRARLKRDGALPVPEALRITREVADALDYAHRRGVVHRDIKPENIILHDGNALVTDFGIAKAVSSARAATPDPDANRGGDVTDLTAIGSAIGTPAYMCPEQAAGEPDLDGRADVYSLGCVLYELLTGQAPYRGTGAHALIAQHFSAPVPRARASRGDVPHAIDDAIAVAMAKEPSKRFASAALLRDALDPDAPADAVDRGMSSIAVLPLENLDGDASHDYLSDGITEEILNSLGRLAGVRVAARTSSFALRTRHVDAREIAAKLDVRYLLQGSVRTAGTRLRVSAQLMDAHTGFQLWSDRFDRELRDVFAIQDEIAAIIARRLETQFATGAPRRTSSLDAYDAYLRGRHCAGRGGPESWREAIAWYERAVGCDASYADAYASIGQALAYLSFLAGDASAAPRARAAVDRAVTLDPGNAEAHASSAFVSFWLEWDFAAAERAARRAVALNPSSASAHETLSALLANLGRAEEALAATERSLALDPLSLNTRQTAAWVYTATQRYADAVQQSRAGLELAPDSFFGFVGIAWALVELGTLDEARRAYAELLRLAPGNGMATAGMAVIESRAANRAEALRWLEQARSATPRSHTFLTWAYAALGMRDEAFEALDRAIAAKESSATCMPVFTWWDPLRADPRFLAALKKAGYPESSFSRTHAFIEAARAGVGRTPPETTSIVVLPFLTPSADRDTELFADGLSDELITDLSGIAPLRVISRVSARQLKGTTKDVRTIGRELNVGYVLSGSVRRAGNILRVATQLVDVPTEAEVWADRFDATLDELFDVQERLSRRIADALRARLTPEESRRLAARPMSNIEAYECFVKARSEALAFSQEGALRAIGTARRGLAIVGDNAHLFGVLGHAHAFYASLLSTDQAHDFDEAERAARRAAELDPASAYPQFILGYVQFLKGNVQEAVRIMRAGLEKDHRNPDLLFWLIEAYVVSGRCDAARPLAKELAAVDPLTPTSRSMVGFVELMDGKVSAALGPYRDMYAQAPENPYVRWAYAIIIAWNGLRDEACQVLDAIIADTPNTFWAMLARFMRPALSGDRERALAAATPELQDAARNNVFWSWLVAQMYALIDEREPALRLLENAVARGLVNYPLLATFDPLIENVRREPAFRDLMQRVRVRWEAFDQGPDS